eukprot:jgi/Psemu1/22405/gm1.22405_g
MSSALEAPATWGYLPYTKNNKIRKFWMDGPSGLEEKSFNSSNETAKSKNHRRQSLEKIEYNKHIQTADDVSETVKVKVPFITAGASLFQILYTINEFTHAKKALSFTTRPKLIPNVAITINTCINYKFNNIGCILRSQTFINNIKKTINMTVHQFLSMVTFHNHVIVPLLPRHPAANALINDNNFKSLIFESMPIEWKDSYEERHSPYEDLLNQIVTRMERYQNKLNKKTKRNQDNSSQNRNSRNNKGSNGSNNNSRGNGNNNKTIKIGTTTTNQITTNPTNKVQITPTTTIPEEY